MSNDDTYPFKMTRLGHQQRLTWLIETYDKIDGIAQYSQEQVAKHQFVGQDAVNQKGLLLELINYHKREIARIDEGSPPTEGGEE